mgnify:CR=1 FL=1
MSKRVFITRDLKRLKPIYPTDWQVRSWHSPDQAVTREELERRLPDTEGLLCMLTDVIDEDLLDRAPHLRVIATLSVGYDHVDVEQCSKRGILVCNTPDVLTETTADLVFSLLLATARRIPEADRVVRENRWQGWSPLFLAGQDVHGKTIGIIGLGRIGLAVARRAMGFKMRILYHNRRPSSERASAVGAEYCQLDELLRRSDYVCLLAPLNETSRGMIGERELELMKPGSYLINAARGALIDEMALVRALKAGRIAGAGLDVYAQEPLPADHPLRECPNVVLLPHIGSASVETRAAMAQLCVDSISAVLEGKCPDNVVNPEAFGEGKAALDYTGD